MDCGGGGGGCSRWIVVGEGEVVPGELWWGRGRLFQVSCGGGGGGCSR